MKHLFLILGVAGFPFLSGAIPNSFTGNGNLIPFIPAFPRFGADLTEEFLDEAKWKAVDFSGPWQDEPSLDGQLIRRMSANPIVFGSVPMAVYSYGDESKLDELVIHFLDAGQFFGYRSGGESNREERVEGKGRRAEFAKHFRHLSRDIEKRLEDGCGRGSEGSIGRTEALRTEFTDYEWEGFVLRFVVREDHSVTLHIMRKGSTPKSLVDESLLVMRDRDKETLFASRAESNKRGDTQITSLPMFTQGNTPFCGIHSLAMVGHYLGLRVSPEALAAGADFKNTGSAKGSDMVGLYRSSAAEIGMRASIDPNFRFDRVERSIQEGLPVIVWRRVSAEREKAHSAHLAAWEKNPELALSVPNAELIASFPDKGEKGSASHASVITGINPDRSEVIFTEPWGENTRNRRMRVEEMEASAYAVFFFKW